MTPSVSSLIRENELHQLRSLLQTGRQYGMCTMNQSLANLYAQELVSWEEIVCRTSDPQDLASLVKSPQQGYVR